MKFSLNWFHEKIQNKLIKKNQPVPNRVLSRSICFAFSLTEQWNVDHKTCPVCRETLASTDDGWVISEGPDSLDVATEIQKSLMDLAQ